MEGGKLLRGLGIPMWPGNRATVMLHSYLSLDLHLVCFLVQSPSLVFPQAIKQDIILSLLNRLSSLWEEVQAERLEAATTESKPETIRGTQNHFLVKKTS